MSYFDYGAFVFCDGIRRRDKECAPAFPFRHEMPLVESESSLRSTYFKMKMQGGDFQQNEDYHAVLGDSNVRVGIFGIGMLGVMIWSVDENTGKVSRVCGEDIIKESAGDRYSPLDGAINLPENATEEEKMKAKEATEEHLLFTHGPYEYNMTWNDYRFCFRTRERRSGIHIDSSKPRYVAEMTTPDGEEWICFYDDSYGAGFTDRDGREHDYDVLSTTNFDQQISHNVMKSHAIKSVNWPIDAVGKEGRKELNDASLLCVTKCVCAHDGEILYLGAECDCGNRYKQKSTLKNDSFVDPVDFVEILNMGIRLAKQGIDEVDVNKLLNTRYSKRPPSDLRNHLECVYNDLSFKSGDLTDNPNNDAVLKEFEDWYRACHEGVKEHLRINHPEVFDRLDEDGCYNKDDYEKIR